jgi:hypothetical protein
MTGPRRKPGGPARHDLFHYWAVPRPRVGRHELGRTQARLAHHDPLARYIHNEMDLQFTTTGNTRTFINYK